MVVVVGVVTLVAVVGGAPGVELGVTVVVAAPEGVAVVFVVGAGSGVWARASPTANTSAAPARSPVTARCGDARGAPAAPGDEDAADRRDHRPEAPADRSDAAAAPAGSAYARSGALHQPLSYVQPGE